MSPRSSKGPVPAAKTRTTGQTKKASPKKKAKAASPKKKEKENKLARKQTAVQECLEEARELAAALDTESKTLTATSSDNEHEELEQVPSDQQYDHSVNSPPRKKSD